MFVCLFVCLFLLVFLAEGMIIFMIILACNSITADPTTNFKNEGPLSFETTNLDAAP